VYQALMNGADFSELARRVSQDQGSAPSGGELPGLSKGQTLPAFDAAAFALKEGEISRPVLTEVGYHVIKMKARKQLEPYEEVKNDIYQFIEKREIRESIARNRVKAMAEGSGKTEQQIMDERADSISAINQDMKYLIKEYHDGLLLYEISNREVWEKASKDEPGLQVFYNKNKKKYKWDEPRFKGIAYHTRDAKDVEAVKKSLKKEPFSKWADILRTTFNNDSVLRIRAEKGIFKKGDNGLVDKEQFKVADAKVKEIKDFPYTSTYGKMLKGPEEMDDVRSLVVGDYQDSMEKAWVEQLKKRYPVSVDEKVLSTVKADK
jgi:peptidyl-prolyl cis-trans isomerase SurA